MCLFRIFQRKEKSDKTPYKSSQDFHQRMLEEYKRSTSYDVRMNHSRSYLINGKWVHVPNCVDETPWEMADESPDNPNRVG